MAGDDLTLYYGEILLLQFRLLSFVMSLCLFAPACLLMFACINDVFVMFLSLELREQQNLINLTKLNCIQSRTP